MALCLQTNSSQPAGQSRFNCVGLSAGSPPSGRLGGVSPGCPPSGWSPFQQAVGNLTQRRHVLRCVVPRFNGGRLLRTRHWSSPKVTSRPQRSRFSMLQCVRTTSSSRSAGASRLLMQYQGCTVALSAVSRRPTTCTAERRFGQDWPVLKHSRPSLLFITRLPCYLEVIVDSTGKILLISEAILPQIAGIDNMARFWRFH